MSIKDRMLKLSETRDDLDEPISKVTDAELADRRKKNIAFHSPKALKALKTAEDWIDDAAEYMEKASCDDIAGQLYDLIKVVKSMGKVIANAR